MSTKFRIAGAVFDPSNHSLNNGLQYIVPSLLSDNELGPFIDGSGNLTVQQLKYSSLYPVIKPAQPSNSGIWLASNDSTLTTGELYIPDNKYDSALIQIYKTSYDDIDYSPWLDSINNGDIIQLRQSDDPLDFAIYVIDSVRATGIIYTFDITLINTGNVANITVDKQYFISYVSKGNTGAQG